MRAAASLRLDDDGDVHLDESSEDPDGEVLSETSRRLGPACDPATSWRVPDGLDDDYEALAAEWADRVAYGRACRHLAEGDYLAGIGAL